VIHLVTGLRGDYLDFVMLSFFSSRKKEDQTQKPLMNVAISPPSDSQHFQPPPRRFGSLLDSEIVLLKQRDDRNWGPRVMTASRESRYANHHNGAARQKTGAAAARAFVESERRKQVDKERNLLSIEHNNKPVLPLRRVSSPSDLDLTTRVKPVTWLTADAPSNAQFALSLSSPTLTTRPYLKDHITSSIRPLKGDQSAIRMDKPPRSPHNPRQAIPPDAMFQDESPIQMPQPQLYLPPSPYYPGGFHHDNDHDHQSHDVPSFPKPFRKNSQPTPRPDPLPTQPSSQPENSRPVSDSAVQQTPEKQRKSKKKPSPADSSSDEEEEDLPKKQRKSRKKPLPVDSSDEDEEEDSKDDDDHRCHGITSKGTRCTRLAVGASGNSDGNGTPRKAKGKSSPHKASKSRDDMDDLADLLHTTAINDGAEEDARNEDDNAPIQRFCRQHAKTALSDKGTYAGNPGKWVLFDGKQLGYVIYHPHGDNCQIGYLKTYQNQQRFSSDWKWRRA
jgi:hypothetical protein